MVFLRGVLIRLRMLDRIRYTSSMFWDEHGCGTGHERPIKAYSFDKARYVTNEAASWPPDEYEAGELCRRAKGKCDQISSQSSPSGHGHSKVCTPY